MRIRKLMESLLDKHLNSPTGEQIRNLLSSPGFIDENLYRRHVIGVLENEDTIDEVKDFLKVQKRLDFLQDFGLTSVVEKLAGLELAKNPNVRLPLQQILGNQFTPAYQKSQQLVEFLQRFVYDKNIEDLVTEMSTMLNEYAEDIYLLNFKNYIKQKNFNTSGSLSEALQEYLENRSTENRIQLISRLTTYSFDGGVREFKSYIEGQNKTDALKFRAMNENTFEVKGIYSFILPTENQMVFKAGPVFLKKIEDKIVEAESVDVPPNFLELCNIISQSNYRVSESGVEIWIDKSKISMSVNETGKTLSVNEQVVDTNQFRVMMNLHTRNRHQTLEILKAEKVFENLELLMNVDFGKEIYSKVHGDKKRTFVFKVNETFHGVCVDTVNRTIFVSNDNKVVPLRENILEFIQFDIYEAFADYVDGEQKVLLETKERKAELLKELLDAEGVLEKLQRVNQQVKDDSVYSEVIAELQEKISLKKKEYQDINLRLVDLTTTAVLEGWKPGLKVSVEMNGEKQLGQIIGVNNADRSYTVLLQNGETHDVAANTITPLEDAAEESLQDMEKSTKKLQTESLGSLAGWLGDKKKVLETESSQIGYGVKGKFASHRDEKDKKVVNPNEETKPEDKEVLEEIVGKLQETLNQLKDVENFLKSYQKISSKPVSNVINQINAYLDSIQTEISEI